MNNSQEQDKISAWLKIGKKNIWIRESYDPPFNEKSFVGAGRPSLEDLADIVCEGNWCLGSVFYCGNICLINQINGCGEWLVIKGDTPFESWTVGGWAMSRDELLASLYDINAATVAECKALEWKGKYSSNPSTISKEN